MPAEGPPAVVAARIEPLPTASTRAALPESAGAAVIAALSVETACLARRMRRIRRIRRATQPSPLDAEAGSRAPRISLYQCGPGAAQAALLAAEAASAGAAGLVSWGLAGGLVPAAEPGAVVLPRRILSAHGAPPLCADAAWQARLAEALRPRFRLLEDDLLASHHVLGEPEEKTRAANETGAVAVDMESAGIAEAAAAAGLPFVALRVVADGAVDRLPPGIERWIDAHGDRRAAAVAGAAFRPAEWGALLVLGRRYAAARRTLEALAERLVPCGFLLRLGTP
jgi:adenosylhomocysteine nucleosidase